MDVANLIYSAGQGLTPDQMKVNFKVQMYQHMFALSLDGWQGIVDKILKFGSL